MQALRLLCEGGHGAHDALGPRQQRCTVFAEAHALRLALKECHPQFGLELFNLQAHGRLAEVDLFARPRQATRLGHRDENTQTLDIHEAMI